MVLANTADSKIKVARPTINIGGQDDALLSEGLIDMAIVETVDGLYRCEARFGNWGTKNGSVDFLYFDRQKVDFGKTVIVKIGDDKIFEGRIMALEGNFPTGSPPEITLLAEDRLQDMRMTRRTRTFSQASDSDVFTQIANDHSLTPQINVSGPQYTALTQVNQSDLAFLRERARAIEAELWIDGSTLNVKPRSQRGSDKVEMSYGNELYEFHVLADLAGQRTAVIASGWDVANKKAISHEATESLLSSELNGLTSGASILSSSSTGLGTRKELLAHTVPFTTQEAQYRAESYFKISARRFLVGHGTAEANAKLRVGVSVDLKGLGPLFNGKYYLSEVRFIFGVLGLTVEFVAERPGLGQA